MDYVAKHSRDHADSEYMYHMWGQTVREPS